MDKKTSFFVYSFLALIFTVAGMICILFYVNLKNSSDFLSLAQSLAVYAMLFLSIGLFYESNTPTWEKKPFGLFSKILGKCCLVLFLILIPIIYILSNGQIIIPIFMALVALGFFCSNRVFTMKFEPDELSDIQNTLQFFETPLGQLFSFLIALAIIGTVFAGLLFIFPLII